MLDLGADLAEEVPRQLGPYRILERIGEGGMGVVYLAEQARPLLRRVAIKLARTAVSGGRALARFESERQTLAVMNHPNIARVFDAGSAPDGRPYFVMEYVAGKSITEFCDAQRLGIEPRLELVLRVCEGVQHAHVNAVIHRDLKPSNILVTTESGPATPKIIDFGVAKALQSGVRREGTLTQFGQIVGTPEYMSPEQAALDGRPVDTRTDVYALGVVLYELLVGGRPFERESGPDASLVDLCRRIREQEPERPSVRALRASSVEAARARGLPPRTLARRLRGDLDAITMKALAKDPGSRYATPSDMAADLERHLGHRPIQARRPGVLHRLGKAFRRHRTAATVIAALSATLLCFVGLGAVQALRAQREAARAEADARVAGVVREFLLGMIDPPVPLTTQERGTALVDTPKRDVLLGRIRERFSDQPVLLSQLLLAAGNHLTYSGAGQGIAVLEDSRDRIVSLLGPDSAQAIAANERLARVYTDSRRLPEADRLLLDALERRRRLVGPDHPDTWRTTSHLAELYKWWPRHEEAAPLFEAAIAGLERALGPDDPDVLSTKVGLSGSYLELGRYADAQALLERALDPIRRVFGERNYQMQVALYNLACAHANAGRIEPALAYLGESIGRGWNYPFGPAHDPLLLPLHGDPRFQALDRAGRLNDGPFWTAAWYGAQRRVREGRLGEAEPLLRDLIAAVERVEGSGAGGRAIPVRLALATCWIRRGRFDEAERLLSATLAASRTEANGGDDPGILDLLAQCDLGRGRREAALGRIERAAALQHPVFGHRYLLYAQAQRDALRGQDEAALRLLARASELGFDDADRLEHDLTFGTLRGRAEFLAIAKAVRARAL